MSVGMLSLYDYLGRAAGPDLGKSVATFAHIVKTPIALREVSNPKYSGTVNLYTKEFLELYFSNSNHKNTIIEDIEWYKKRLNGK